MAGPTSGSLAPASTGWTWEETDAPTASPASAAPPQAHFLEVSESEGGEDLAPEAEDVPATAHAPRDRDTAPSGVTERWAHRLHLAAFGALVLLVISLTIGWAVDLAKHTPLLGWPAITLLATLIIVIAVEGTRQWVATARLRQAEEMRETFSQARLGIASEYAMRSAAAELHRHMGNPRKAAFPDGTPIGADQPIAVRELERIILSERDAAAVAAIVRASRQAALVALVSPSAISDVPLYLFRSYMMMGTIARIYGYRPATLARARMIKQAIADGSMLGVAMVAFDEAARSGGSIVKQVGSHLTKVGTVANNAGRPFVGVSAVLVGEAMSGAGELAEEVGGPLSEGLAVALRMARFGLLAITATRPIPLQRGMETELAGKIRKGIVTLHRR